MRNLFFEFSLIFRIQTADSYTTSDEEIGIRVEAKIH